METGASPQEILANLENLKCTCHDQGCKWHGSCKECIALHRYYSTLPNCLAPNEEMDSAGPDTKQKQGG